MKIFYDLINLISGTKYPIANVYFVEIYRIRQVLNEWMQSSTEVIRDMASNMFNKFQKYWKDVSDVMTIAVMLDPRYKMKIIKFYFPQIYGYDELDAQLERIKNMFYDLLKEYASPLQFESSSFSHSHSSGSEVSTLDVLNDFQSCCNFLVITSFLLM